MTSLPTTDPAAKPLRTVRIAAGVAGLLLIAAVFLGAGTDVLLALPVVFLASALLAGRYPGLETLERIAAHLRRRPRRATRTCSPARGFGSLEPRALRLLVGTRILRGPPAVSPVRL